VLTRSAGGDDAAAVFHAALASMAGVFVSPALVLAYTGVKGSVNLAEVFAKLAVRVVLPVLAGQLLYFFYTPAVQLVHENKQLFKRLQEYTLVYIVYAVFCQTFSNSERGSDTMTQPVWQDYLWMAIYQLFLLLVVMIMAWFLLRLLWRDEPRLRVMGLYGCTQKSVAMGVPLIHAIYEHDPKVGLYTLPLLIWHPLQLIIGSAIAPRLADGVERMEAFQGRDARKYIRLGRESLKRVSLVAWGSAPDLAELSLEEDTDE